MKETTPPYPAWCDHVHQEFVRIVERLGPKGTHLHEPVGIVFERIKQIAAENHENDDLKLLLVPMMGLFSITREFIDSDHLNSAVMTLRLGLAFVNQPARVKLEGELTEAALVESLKAERQKSLFKTAQLWTGLQEAKKALQWCADHSPGLTNHTDHALEAIKKIEQIKKP